MSAAQLTAINDRKGKIVASYRERAKRLVDAQELQFTCTFVGDNGETLEALKGDFLVTEKSGEQCIMDAEEFHNTFEAIGKRGPKAPKSDELEDC
jgi:hypothetical protein